MLFSKYHIAGKLVDKIFIVGKMNHSSMELQSDEVGAVIDTYRNADFEGSVVHKRLLIHGVLFSSTLYQRQSSTSCDYVMCFDDGQIGFVTKYMSFCLTDCSCSSGCTHIAIAQVFLSAPHHLINDPLTGATAMHVHCFDNSQLVTIPYSIVHIIIIFLIIIVQVCI